MIRLVGKWKLWLSLLLDAASLLLLALPLFGIQVADRVYRPGGLRILLSGLSLDSRLIAYPPLLRLSVLLIGAGLLAAFVLTLVKKPQWAALAGVMAGTFSILARLFALDLQVSFTALDLGQSEITPAAGLTGILLMTCLAAVLLLWSEGGEQLAKAVFRVSASLSVASVVLITVYMLIAGLPAIGEIGLVPFIFGTVWKPTHATNPQFGIFYMILGTLAATGGSVVIGVPIGLLTAVFLAELAPRRVAAIVRPAIELLAGIPSVIFGFFGLQLLVPLVQRLFGIPTGATLFSAILILSIMILPTIVSTAETGLRAVPAAYREASLAIGATQIETIFRVLVPAARASILSGIILGVGRAIGETMAVIMVAGNGANLPELFKAVKPLTVGIALEMSYASGLHRQALFAIGLILFIFIMFVNLSFSWISRRGVQMDDCNE